MITQNGYALLRCADNVVLDWWPLVPLRVDTTHPDGTIKVLMGVSVGWSDGVHSFVARTREVPDPEPVRRQVPKSVIIRRLHEVGLLNAASVALNSDLYTRERWYSPDRPDVYADDPEALALLQAIGADPAEILAP